MSRLPFLAAAVLAPVLAGCASQAVVTPVATRPGRLVKLAFYSDAQANCRSNGDVRVRVVQPPAGGVLEMRTAQDFRPYTQACNMTRVPGTQLWYRGAGRVADTAVVEVTYPQRAVRTETFLISVR